MALRSFSQNMLRLVPPFGGVSLAFASFLEVAVLLNSGDGDDRFRNLVVRYDKRERYIFMEAYASLVLEMSGDGSGLTDVLGEFWCRHIKSGRKFPGQKFCDMLPGLMQYNGMNYRVADYCCGSGRRLLAAARFNRNFRFFGADPDITNCMMTLLNLCLNGLFGEVAWFDAEHNRFFCAWNIDLDANGKPAIFTLPNEKSLMFQKRYSALPDTSKLIFNY